MLFLTASEILELLHLNKKSADVDIAPALDKLIT